MKKIVKLFSLTLIVSLLALACKDNFSEQDFINYQLKQKNYQDSLTIVKMNQAGQLLSYTLQVIEDKTPVSGVAVAMSNPPSGGTGTATTDASGFATFTNVQIGANTFVVSKTGYLTATFIVDFGTITNGTNYTIVNNTIIPIKKTASNQVPIFATGTTGATATIKGVVTIETDLTNTAPEIPQGITIKANLSQIVAPNANTNSGSAGATANGQANIVTYFFNSGTIGTAAVDNTTGAYTMTVPASADGRIITMIYPEVSANQKVGFTKLNGVNTTPQILSTVPAVYGPSFTYDNVPQVSGVMATFSPAAPSAPGSGLKFAYTVAPRSLTPTTLTNPSTSVLDNNTLYQLTNRGSGYSASPAITVTGGGASAQATMNASLAGVATGVSITAGGSGYTGSITLTLQQTDGVTTANVLDAASSPISFTKDVGVTPTSLTGLTFTLPTSGSGFTTSTPFITAKSPTTGFTVTGFKWNITGGGGSGATATATVSTYVDQIQITNGGTGYTSAPIVSIATSGGTQATFVVQELNTQWTIAPDNSANTSPYKVLPTGVTLGFNTLSGNSVNNSVTDQFGVSTTLFNDLTVSGGNVTFIDPSRTYKTSGFSQSQPSAVVTPSVSTPASALVSVNASLTSSSFGQVTGLNAPTVVAGAGYDVPLTVTIAPVAGAAGSGAKLDISQQIAYSNTTKTYTWNGTSSVTSAGSGYQPFLNMFWVYYFGQYSGTASTNPVVFSGNATITVKTGDVVVQDVVYGTGLKKMNVN